MTTKFDLDDDSLVVIIGSGAGGGTLANELAQKGIKSVVLEAGPRFGQEDIVNDEWAMFNKISWLDKRISAGEWHGKRNHPTLPAWIVKGYGGSTIHWAGVSLRFQEHEFRMRTLNGDIPGASVADWPLTLAELAPYYEAAERKMGVTGPTTGMPHLPWHNSFRVLAEGARRMGYRDIVSGPMAINSVENDGRPACQQYGFCMSGCMVGAKWSTMITELPRAEATGKCEIRCDAMALKIEHDARGKVTAVLYADGAGNIQRQKARLVCVAGNAIESPRLLLNSASSMFPDGLANSSGQVGRNYMTHNSAGVFAEMPEKVHMNRGTTVAGVISDEARNDPSRGFYAGYRLEILALGLPFLSVFLNPSASGWGREHAQALEKYAYMSGTWICGEDLPQAGNGITLHPSETDQHGLPVPIVTKTPHINEVNMAAHAYEQTGEMYRAVGATKVWNLPSYPASHNMGTNRMAAKASEGVVDGWGRAHDVRNLFVSDGSTFPSSSAANPTLTIVALAIRQAEHIAREMAAGSL